MDMTWDEFLEWEEMLCVIAGRDGVPCNNPSRIIVFGISANDSSWVRRDILQISIIDGNGNVLLNSYVKPRCHTSWSEAEAVNGITPEMVADAPAPEDLIPVVKGIFASADTIIAYNSSLDLLFLRVWGIVPAETQTVVDVMLPFAAEYGEWDNWSDNYKVQKLSTAAEYYGYKFKTHDSLEYARATFYVYNRMLGS